MFKCPECNKEKLLRRSANVCGEKEHRCCLSCLQRSVHFECPICMKNCDTEVCDICQEHKLARSFSSICGESKHRVCNFCLSGIITHLNAGADQSALKCPMCRKDFAEFEREQPGLTNEFLSKYFSPKIAAMPEPTKSTDWHGQKSSDGDEKDPTADGDK